MKNFNESNNQIASVFLTIVFVGALVYAAMFMNTEPTKKGLYSYNQIAKTTTSKVLVKGNSKSGFIIASETNSSIGRNTVSSDKKSSGIVSNQTQAAGIDVPASTVMEIYVPTTTKQTATQMQPMGFGVSSIRYISTSKEVAPESKIGTLSLINIKSAQIATNTQLGSKPATQSASAVKTTTTDISGKSGQKKIDGNPGEPGVGGSSLPIGDGGWMLLMFGIIYGMTIKLKTLFLKVVDTCVI